MHALIKKKPPQRDLLDINEAIREVSELTLREAVKNDVTMQTELADGLPFIHGDRVGLQQVILNLIINAFEAMSGASKTSRDLLISSRKADSGHVIVAVRDSGPGLGLGLATFERAFDAFYTTKSSGLGLGLSICRSIVEAHGGRLWVRANHPKGATFQFAVPAVDAD
jgi:signal transduction histidine kinase